MNLAGRNPLPGRAIALALFFLPLYNEAQHVVAQNNSQIKSGTSLMVVQAPVQYPDGRPVARYRLEAKDHGIVLRHGNGPRGCDSLGARDIWVWQHRGVYYMHYAGGGANGWRAG